MGNKAPTIQCQFCQKLSSENKVVYRVCKVCSKGFCSTCNENPILMQGDVQKYLDSKAEVIMSILCPTCFQKESTIDFNTQVEVIGEENKLNLLWIHGAMSSRKMFKVHAEILAKQGFRSVLIDLPAHGSQIKTPFTIQNCIEHIYKMRKEHCTGPPIAIGGSLGGYMLMETIKQYPSKKDFAGIVIGMASQNVGLGRSLKASFGLIMIQKSTKLISTETMGKYMLTMAKNIDKEIIIQFGRAGLFFDQMDRRTDILRETNSIEGVKAYEGPILFLNGQKDYKDSLQLWFSSTKIPSQSKIYKDSDHFFSHDKRYLQEFAEDIRNFSERVLKEQVV